MLLLAVTGLGKLAAQSDKVRGQMRKQWKADPVSCLEALRFFAINNPAAALERLQRGQSKQVRELYQDAWESALPQTGERYGFPWKFYELLVPDQVNSCSRQEAVRTLAEEQAKRYPDSVHQFVSLYVGEPSDSAGMRRQALALYQLLYPQRSNRPAIDVYLSNWRCPVFTRLEGIVP